jgi:hypothetical protein
MSNPGFSNAGNTGPGDNGTGQPMNSLEATGFPLQMPQGATPVVPPVYSLPGQTASYSPTTGPALPGPVMPYSWPPQANGYSQAAHVPAVVPYWPAPAQPKRRGRSVGWIILSISLALLLVFIVLGTVLYEVGSRAVAANQARQDTAMQLYQQVISKPPAISDTLTGSAPSWDTYQHAPYACAQERDGLYVSAAQTGMFAPCFAQNYGVLTNFAFQITMRVNAGAGGGLLLRASTSESVFYVFRVDTNGVYVVNAYTSANDSIDLTHGVTAALSKQAGATNVLTVIARGQQFDMYLNGHFVTLVQDKTFASGIVGVIASDEKAMAQVVYTDAKVWKL